MIPGRHRWFAGREMLRIRKTFLETGTYHQKSSPTVLRMERAALRITLRDSEPGGYLLG
jgi:hypothetical protein